MVTLCKNVVYVPKVNPAGLVSVFQLLSFCQALIEGTEDFAFPVAFGGLHTNVFMYLFGLLVGRPYSKSSFPTRL